MRYIKTFENFNHYRFKVGQDVVALSTSGPKASISRVKGVVYNIKDICFCNKCGLQYLNFGEKSELQEGWCTSCENKLNAEYKYWMHCKHYAPLDEKTLEKLLEDAVNDEDYELAASLRDIIKSFKKEEKEEVVTIEDWKKY